MKHPECETAKENLNVIFSFIKRALEAVHNIVVDSGSLYDTSEYNAYFSPISDVTFTKCCRQLEVSNNI